MTKREPTARVTHTGRGVIGALTEIFKDELADANSRYQAELDGRPAPPMGDADLPENNQ